MSMNEIPEEIDQKLHLLARNIAINVHQLREATKNITLKHIEDHEGNWPRQEQYFKIIEEVVESEKAYARNYNDENEEHFDILFALLTLYHIRDKSKEEDEKAIYDCLVKFHRKGWLL